MFKKISDEIKQHHLLILILAGVLASYFCYDKYISYASDRDDKLATASAQALADQKAQNAQLAARVVQTDQQLVATTAQYQQTLAALTGQLASLAREAAAAKANVQNLAPPELASQTQIAIGMGTVRVAPNSPGDFLFDTPAAQETLRKLIQARADVAALPLKDQQFAEQGKVVGAQSESIKALKAEGVGKDEALKKSEANTTAQVTACQANAKKGKSKWFKIGYALGFASGWLANHFAGK